MEGARANLASTLLDAPFDAYDIAFAQLLQDLGSKLIFAGYAKHPSEARRPVIGVQRRRYCKRQFIGR